MRQHWRRLWACFAGTYKPGHPLWPEGRESEHKGYVGELLHGVKNVPVEYLRYWGIYDRGNKLG